MGQVYRARDTQLKREVALKVLPADVSSDIERLARFQREAEVLASLNHPHIAHIYGIQEEADVRAIVMELVEGDTLEQLIARGPLTLDNARPLAIQITEALSYAHERGIVHRDLKPANIKITADGSIKVLDFGLAKLTDTASDAASGATAAVATDNSQTIDSPALLRQGKGGPATQVGAVQLGHCRLHVAGAGARRCSRQASRRVGFRRRVVRDADRRAAVPRVIRCPTPSQSVLKSEPDWGRLPAGTPPAVHRLLRRCLQKDRRQRLHDIGDARIELEEDTPSAEIPTAPSSRSKSSRSIRAAALIGAGVALTLLGVGVWMRSGETAQVAGAPFQFLITPSDGVSLDDPPHFALSPDGRTIAIRGTEAGTAFLYLRSLTTGVVRRLNNSRGVGISLAWSPDSQWVAFTGTKRLSTASPSMTTTREREVSTNEELPFAANQGMSWSGHDEIAVLDERRSGGGRLSWRASATAQRTDVSSRALHVAVSGCAPADGWSCNSASPAPAAISTSSRRGRRPDALRAGFSRSMWVAGCSRCATESLLAWRFDADRGEITGEPVVIRNNVLPRVGPGGRLFSASATGIVAIRNDQQVSTRLAWFDRSGSETGTLAVDRHCRNPELSPDGSRLAMECYESTTTTSRDIWLYDSSRATARRASRSTHRTMPIRFWSPDGRTIVFASSRRGHVSVFRKNAGGATPEELMFETAFNTPTMSWSSDGALHCTECRGEVRHVRGQRAARVQAVRQRPLQRYRDAVLAKGRLRVVQLDGIGSKRGLRAALAAQRRQVADLRRAAVWTRDGARTARELFYLSLGRELMSAAIDTSRGFRAAAPARLFPTTVSGQLITGHRFPLHAVSRDGKRFLMYRVGRQRPRTERLGHRELAGACQAVVRDELNRSCTCAGGANVLAGWP